jgi:serine/threonine-protein kinase
VPIEIDRLRRPLADRYTIEREIGRGGMAVVYLAQDLKHGRQVAVKVLQPELASSLGSERFLREIETAARLNHPHILPLHDSGEADGFLYYVMPYMESSSLRDQLDRESQLPVEDAVRIACEVAKGLDYAHEQAVVHRDIKPGNIMLSRGHAVIADFGIARAVSEAGGERVTKTGISLGSPIYMSPEQASGSETVDGRADIYALGCVLYEMLAGEPPYSGKTAAALMARKSLDMAPSLRAMRDTVPPGVEQAVAKTLAKVPADRFATAGEFAETLTTAMSAKDQEAAAAGAGRGTVTRGTHRASRGRRIAGAALVLVVLAALAIGSWLNRGRGVAGDSTIRSVAVLPFADMSPEGDQEYFSDGISEELLNLLGKIPALRVAARTSSFSFKGQNLEIPEIAARLNVAHVLEGSVRKSGNEVRITAQLIRADDGFHVWSETWNRSLDDVFEVQEDIAIAVVNALRISLLGEAPKTRRTDPQTYQLFLEGQYLRRQITDASLRKAIEAFKQAVEIDPTYVPAWADLADTYLWRGEAALADQAIQTAISIDPDYAYVYYVRGVSRIFSESRFKEGIEDFQHALELDPDDAFIIAAIGKGAFITGDFDLAIEQFQAGLNVEPVPEFYWFLGMAYRGAGRFDDAEASFRKMLSLSPQYRGGHFHLWEALFLRGELDAALAVAEQQGASWNKAASLAITHYALGNEEQSDSILADLVANGAAGSIIAEVYGYRGEVDKAFEWLNRAQEADEARLFILSEPAFSNLHSDPRWQPYLREMNLLEYWLEMPPEWGGPPG